MNTLFREPQTGTFAFPQRLTEKYQPKLIDSFVGLDKPKRWASTIIRSPRPCSAVFVGPAGIGKSTFAMALAEAIPAELIHVPAQKCTADMVDTIGERIAYMPRPGRVLWLCLIEEADQMTDKAQLAFLSKTDETATLRPTFGGGMEQGEAPPVIIIFTCNTTEGLERRFLSRSTVLQFSSHGVQPDAVKHLERIWLAEAGTMDGAPNLARIVKEANGNIREAMNVMELELMTREG